MNQNLIRFLLTFLPGFICCSWIGSIIINHTALKPEGFKCRTLSYFFWGFLTCGIYTLVASLCNFAFDANKEKNIGYFRD